MVGGWQGNIDRIHSVHQDYSCISQEGLGLLPSLQYHSLCLRCGSVSSIVVQETFEISLSVSFCESVSSQASIIISTLEAGRLVSSRRNVTCTAKKLNQDLVILTENVWSAMVDVWSLIGLRMSICKICKPHSTYSVSTIGSGCLLI